MLHRKHQRMKIFVHAPTRQRAVHTVEQVVVPGTVHQSFSCLLTVFFTMQQSNRLPGTFS